MSAAGVSSAKRAFDPAAYLPQELFAALTELRIDDPGRIVAEAERRQRREKLAVDGKLVILAVDHPARRVTKAPGDPLGMGDRHSYLARTLRALSAPGIDGVMGATDFMEELLLVEALLREKGKQSLLDGKALIGCMNRGGQAGVAGEIDDRFTSFTVESLQRLGFEGGKMMYRFDPEDPKTIDAMDDCAQAVTALSRAGLYAFVEPLSVARTTDGYRLDNTVEQMIRNAGSAAALGETSAHTWLKLPYAEGYERVARATTLPILMLGGFPGDTPNPMLESFRAGMDAGPNIRGAMVGRNVTFAVDEDPRAVAAAVGAVVHRGLSAAEAAEVLEAERGKEMDALD